MAEHPKLARAKELRSELEDLPAGTPMSDVYRQQVDMVNLLADIMIELIEAAP